MELAQRSDVLQQFIKAVETARDCIVYTSTETDRILDSVNTKFPSIKENNFFKQDKILYKNFVEKLGNSNTEEQVNFFNGLISDTKRHLAEADKDREGKSKIYTTLGICAGISVSIILI